MYDIGRKYRGRVVIVNCQNFVHLKFRDGSQHDKADLTELFESLGFEVVVWEDKTAQVNANAVLKVYLLQSCRHRYTCYRFSIYLKRHL